MEVSALQELTTGQDGQVRSVTVKLVLSGRVHSILCRPVQLLYPLKIRCKTTAINPDEPSHGSEPPEILESPQVVETMEPPPKEIFQRSSLIQEEHP